MRQGEGSGEGGKKKKTRIGAELLTLVTASSDGTISTGKSGICLSLAEMFARQLKRDGRETQACSEAEGNENLKKKKQRGESWGAMTFLKTQVMARTASDGIN